MPGSWILGAVLLLISFTKGHTQSSNCTADDKFCELCVLMGKQDRANTYFEAPVCTTVFDVADNNTLENVVPRCKETWKFFNYTAECQLAVFPNASLAVTYKDVGIRNTYRRMLIGLERNNCTEQWNYVTGTGESLFGANRSSSLPCSVTRGAFQGLEIVEVDPKSYATNAILCQCAPSTGDLPGINMGPSHGASLLTTLLLLVLPFLVQQNS